MMFAFAFPAGYDSRVTAKSVAPGSEPGDNTEVHPHPTLNSTWGFLCPSFNGGSRWVGWRSSGENHLVSFCLCGQPVLSDPGAARLHMPVRGQEAVPKYTEEPTMKHAPLASAIRARAHRKMAFAAPDPIAAPPSGSSATDGT